MKKKIKKALLKPKTRTNAKKQRARRDGGASDNEGENAA